jgi:hypothetical protein
MEKNAMEMTPDQGGTSGIKKSRIAKVAFSNWWVDRAALFGICWILAFVLNMAILIVLKAPMLMTFIATTCVWLLLMGVICRRVAVHCRANEAATRAVSEHVLMPIFRWQSKDGEQGK